MSFTPHDNTSSNQFGVQQLTRVQQLTLNTWRHAAAKLDRVLDPWALLEHTAIHLVFATLSDVERPVALFARHATADPELALVRSLVRDGPHSELDLDVLDTGFLRRWNDLVARHGGPRELPPLRPRLSNPSPGAR